MSDSIKSRLFTRQESALLLILLPCFVFLVFWNIAKYPVISGWDEGIYLQFAHNWSEHGIYGSTDGDHFHPLMPVGGTGPTLIGSIALANLIFGESLVVARMVMAIFLLLSIAGFYLFIKEISRWEVAIASVFFYLVAGYGNVDTLWVGRQVLAEIPSFAFLFFALWLFIKSLRLESSRFLFASLILFALSVVTKNQIIWILAPAFGTMTIIDRFFIKEKRWIYMAAVTFAVVISYAVWYFIALAIVRNSYVVYLQAQSMLLKACFLHFNVSIWIETAKLFIKSGYALPIVLATLYILLVIRKRRSGRLVRCLLFSLAGYALISYHFLSIPWSRYLHSAIVFSMPLIFLMIYDHTVLLQKTDKLIARVAATGVILILAGFTVYRLVSDIGFILKTDDRHAMIFAELVDNNVPSGEPILNWEWEIEFFSKSSYIHPEYQLFPAMVDQTYNHADAPILYDQRIPDNVKYLVTGPFANQTHVFDDELAQRERVLISQEDEYRLYLLK